MTLWIEVPCGKLPPCHVMFKRKLAKTLASMFSEINQILFTYFLDSEWWNIGKKNLPVRFWNTNKKEEKEKKQTIAKLYELHANSVTFSLDWTKFWLYIYIYNTFGYIYMYLLNYKIEHVLHVDTCICKYVQFLGFTFQTFILCDRHSGPIILIWHKQKYFRNM